MPLKPPRLNARTSPGEAMAKLYIIPPRLLATAPNRATCVVTPAEPDLVPGM